MKLSILLLPLTALLAYAAPVDPNNPQGMSPCLAALAGGCYNGYLDKDCTCPSVPYLHALKRCLKAACPYSDWESLQDSASGRNFTGLV
ncbi:hypothetical protein N7488_000743 [Penicillium malachiteum]|nr:hypothetical protein N7488_000743 [Penicillium malachiteum]